MQGADLRVLFATNFSDACFRASRAIAQLADACSINLSIVHVAKPGSPGIQTWRELESFMAEAGNYNHCRRILLESDDAVGSIADLCNTGGFDLVVAPATDRIGLLRPFVQSFRSRLLAKCNAPLWTAGRSLDKSSFKGNYKTLACLINFGNPSTTHIRLAAALAAKTGAKLRLLSVVDGVDEGTLASATLSDAPLMDKVAAERIRASYGSLERPAVDVTIGDLAVELPRMLKRCDADLVFVGPSHVRRGLSSSRVASYLDRLPCPAVCVDGPSANFAGWKFQSVPSKSRALEVVGRSAERAIAS